MELNPISEETLQALAMKPRSEWTAEERTWVDTDPGLTAEIELYQMIYAGLEEQEDPVFSSDFEAGILAQLPVPVAQTLPQREPSVWWQWAGLSAGFAAALAALVYVFWGRGAEVVANYPKGLESTGESMGRAFSFLQGNEILWGAGVACVVGIFLADRYLKRNTSV